MNALSNSQIPPPPNRIEAIDAARGVALVAMAIYHFTWDLEFFGYVPAGMTGVGGWKLFARCIASTFLFLVGVGLFLGHGRSIRWQPFGQRLAMIVAAAAAISAVTWFAVPQGFIFFGILHEIALASLLGLAFLRLPWPLTAIVAAAVIAAPHWLRADMFEHPAWWWLGLSPTNPRSNDYVPLFPWFGAVLLGIAAAKLATSLGWFARMASWRVSGPAQPLAFAGRHSLAFYLLHQPILIAFVWLAAQIVPPSPEAREASFIRACETTCADSRDSTFCKSYCACMLETLTAEKVIEGVFSGDRSDEQQTRVQDIAGICTTETDDALSGGSQP